MNHQAANPGYRLGLAILTSAFLCLGALPQPSNQVRRLTFEERVRAQEAIERIYYSHQTGATRPFEEAVPLAILEQRVRTYLKQSLALEKFWKAPVTAAALQSEMGRIAANTRFPERLDEIYGALGRDTFLILECLARPVLVDRVSRNFFAMDERIHHASRLGAAELRRRLVAHPFEPRPEDLTRQILDRAQIRNASHWSAHIPKKVGDVSQVLEERQAFVLFVALETDTNGIRVARHTVPKLRWDEWWPTLEPEFDEASVRAVVPQQNSPPAPGAGSRARTKGPSGLSEEAAMDRATTTATSSCVPDDTWDNGILDDLPAARTDHTLVWTGTVMLIWGGRGVMGLLNDGARYDPLLDTFTPISTVDAPEARWFHTAVWTGSEMVVWGGHSDSCCSSFGTGGRYNPASDTWVATSTVGAASTRSHHSVVWTGTEMIVWGGAGSTGTTNSGARYNPASDTWVATSLTGAPARRFDNTAVWTGSRMIVWGGSDDQSRPINTGGLYDPAADSWTPVPLTNAPEARTLHTAVWSGSEMIVWGGTNDPLTNLTDVATGGRYNPAMNRWVSTATAGAPEARHSHAAIWTGSEMIVWGGKWFYFSYVFPLDSGGRYDPTSDTWMPTALTNAPPADAYPVVWTENLMIVWSGNSGGRYDPGADSWTPTSTLNAPSPNTLPTAVWTGNLMIVWTAKGAAPGGMYDPLTDSWRPTATVNSPTARSGHTAVWTGDEMVVWGGLNLSGPTDYFNTGGRYDPIADTWQPTSTVNAPQGRHSYTAVWTGREMIVWGGSHFDTALATGGRYDPVNDAWVATSLAGAPIARQDHSAVWTGTEMIVWGGATPFGGDHDTGGRYDPMTDTWKLTSTLNVPSQRSNHTVVWTGTEMIVWGGTQPGAVYLNTGGRYDPRTDAWMPTSVTNVPEARYGHTAVWTGDEMIVWGGAAFGGVWLNTGGRYDPTTDVWLPTSTIGTPSFPGIHHEAVWTGSFMIVWAANWGGRYALGQAVDDDLDGYSECAGDCNDTNPTVWSPPAEVPYLTVAIGNGTLLSWESQGSASGPETEYDVASGSISQPGAVGLASSTCLFSGASPSYVDSWPDPPRGEGVWYLVRARNSCGVGTYGTPQSDQSVSSCP